MGVTSTILDQQAVVDRRAVGALPAASADVVALWDRSTSCAVGVLPVMGLLAGDRPTADVEVLAGAFAAVEYELARRMHAATTAGSLPLVGPGAVLAARGWASPQSRRLARTGALAAAHPSVAAAWAAGIITSEHVDAVARNIGPLTDDQLAAVITALGTRWGQWSPPMITRLVLSTIRLLHPPADDQPTGGEAAAHASRNLSFALLGDTVILSGTLPRLEGEAVIAAIDALAERLRSTADHVPTGARRADALVELANTAATAGTLPTRGGLPVALTVTLEHTRLGDPVWTTSRGHLLTPSERGSPPATPPSPPSQSPPPDGEPPTNRPTTARTARTPSKASSTPRARHPSTAPHRSTAAELGQPARSHLPPGSPRWPRCCSTAPGSHWQSDAPPGPPPPPNAEPWQPATADASSPDARSRPRTASPTTHRTGPQAELRTSTTSHCSAGHTTAKSTSTCGPSTPPNPEPQSPNHPQEHPREHPGPATTDHPGPSTPNTAPAGDCERRTPELTLGPGRSAVERVVARGCPEICSETWLRADGRRQSGENCRPTTHYPANRSGQSIRWRP